MISVCIPIFNFPVEKLVKELHLQLSSCGHEYEILVMDDASYKLFKLENEGLEDIPNVSYQELPENIGRAAIRNKMASMAKHDNLLFLDCDSGVDDSYFISNYIKEIPKGYDVICGGRIYPNQPDDYELLLHWKYGSRMESKNAQQRQANPYASFMTNNFLIRKDVFKTLTFNEDLRGYGHEDTLFGWELQRHQFRVSHINNPVIHLQIEPAPLFLEKTNQALINLKKIVQKKPEMTKISRVSKLTEKPYIPNTLLRPFAKIACRLLAVFLNKGGHHLSLFQLYKVLYYIAIHPKQIHK